MARALGIARGTLYLKGKQAVKDKQVTVLIEEWHEQDDTMGHRKLAAFMGMGKNRVKRVMKKYGITARRKKKRYVHLGKTSSIVPSLLREAEKNGTDVSSSQESENGEHAPSMPPEVVFSDIFEISLADCTKVRGCFALWKRTRHILSLAFDYRMQAELVVSTIVVIALNVRTNVPWCFTIIQNVDLGHPQGLRSG